MEEACCLRLSGSPYPPPPSHGARSGGCHQSRLWWPPLAAPLAEFIHIRWLGPTPPLVAHCHQQPDPADAATATKGLLHPPITVGKVIGRAGVLVQKI